MNKWIKKSIDLAHSKGYLDKLWEIYPVKFEETRFIPTSIKNEIEKAFKEKDKIKLVKELLKLPKFPIDIPYIPSLRKYPFLLSNNPKTVERIAEIVFSLGINTVLELSAKPKSPSRRLGQCFKKWLENLNYPFLEENEFKSASKIAFLKGSDKRLKYFVNNLLGINLSKGIDFVVKIKNKFILGEAKFLTDYGGTQNNQFRDAIEIAKIKENNVIGVAILDGILWFESDTFMYNTVKSFDGFALSALLLKDFLEEQYNLK
jgi:hypothetical protein